MRAREIETRKGKIGAAGTAFVNADKTPKNAWKRLSVRLCDATRDKKNYLHFG